MCKNKAEFTELVEMYRTLSSEKKRIETALDAVKADMEQYIKTKGKPKKAGSLTLVVFGHDYKVSCIPLENITYDGEKLKELLGDDIAQYQKVKPYTRIDVR